MSLASLASFLPTLPSLPFPSLPQNIQRRLLSFLLRKSVGRFVKGGLDADTVEADLARGSVSVQSLELAEEAIIPLLQGLPISFDSGTIGLVAAQVSWPLSLSSSLSVEVNDIFVVLRVHPPNSLSDSTSTLANSSSTATSTQAPPSSAGDTPDEAYSAMGESLISIAVASEFVKEELTSLEDAELRESLHLGESYMGDVPVPGGFGGAARPSMTRRSSEEEDEVTEVTMLAGLIERILARLTVKMRRVTLRLVMDEEDGTKTEVEVRIADISYSDVKGEELKSDQEKTTIVRAVKIAPPQVLLRTLSPERPIQSSSISSSDSTVSADSNSSEDEQEEVSADHDMMMSQSIADLRTSFVSTSSGGSSMYASARGGISDLRRSADSHTGDSSSDEDSPFLDPEAEVQIDPQEDRRAQQDDYSPDAEPDFRLLLSFGQESIVVNLSSMKSVFAPPPPSAEIPSTTAQPPRRRASELNIQSTNASPITLLVFPDQLHALLHLASALASSSEPSLPSQPNPTPRRSSASVLTVAINLKVVNVVVVYDDRSPLSDSLTSFWAHPSTYAIPHNHLRLRLEGVGAWVVRSPTEPHQTVFPLRSFFLTESTKLNGEVRTLPILVSDPGLAKQYETSSTRTDFPSFESSDWMENRAAEGRSWRVKLTGRQRGSTGARPQTPQTPTKPSAALTVTLENGSTSIKLLPIHIFLDLTLIERLLPLASLLAEALPPSRLRDDHRPSASSTPHAVTPRPATPLSPRRILEELAFEPLEPPRPPQPLEVLCELLRVEVRCPPPSVSRKRGDQLEKIRSGIVIVDLHEIKMVTEVDNATRVVCDTALFCFLPAQASQVSSFLSISALAIDPTDVHTLHSSPPSVLIRQTPSTDLSASSESRNPASSTTTSVDCRIPLLRTSLDKVTLDGLQLFADDLAQWSSLVLASDGYDSDMEPERNPKMIGSRYFGAKSFARQRRMGSDSSESGTDGSSATTFQVSVTDVVVDLFLPSTVPTPRRHLRGLAADLQVTVELLRKNKNDLRAEVVVGDLRFEDLTATSSPIFSRTLPRNLTITAPPTIKVISNSSVEQETGLKESKIDVLLSNFTYYLTADLVWLEELSAFVKAPAGAFETVVPNELTRIRLRVVDGSVHVTPPTLDSRLVLSVGDARLSTNLMPDMPRTTAAIELASVTVLAIEGPGDLQEGHSTLNTGCDNWKARGFVQLLKVERSSIQARQGNGLVLPDFELLLSDTKVGLTICADSVASISALAADVLASEVFKSKSSSSKTTVPSGLSAHQSSADFLASLDPSAFVSAAAYHDMPEILDDDVPANFDYLADALQQGSTVPLASDRDPSRDGEGQVISDIDGETIRMLDPQGLQIIDDYLLVPRTDDRDLQDSSASTVRCRVTNCDLTIHIHEGFDWSSTRKAIEEETKAIRRRLEKIRQLLADGQTPDASAEEASVLMFGSIQLGLPPGASEMPRNQLLAAINEELDDQLGSDAESTVSSWQTFAGQQARPSRKATLVGKARKRLTRSSSFAIEVNLRGVNANYDSHPPPSQTASKIRVDVDTFDIIDNIRTSTWRKFLTELRPSDGGVVRSSGTSMIRFELSNIRSAARLAQDELVLKIKVLPLRLYIDQDALDFLKAFGAFKNPAISRSRPIEGEGTAESEPFFQRVEVLPIKIKLDYKPKRVDYHALRKGKTAELMNFFHFDGSEMTLRHLVVTGVSGSTRLSELVQDIWTPDVKANQLADVISGIAPIRSVVNVGSGVANLVLLPIEQYRKDGRLVRGLQKGASAFAKQTTLEALSVGARLATGTQALLERAEAVLGSRPSPAEPLPALGQDGQVITMLSEEERAELISRYAEQPNDLREGLESAYRSLGDNFRSAAQTILAVPMEVYERSGDEGPVRAVVRAVPIAVLKPMIGASEAVSKALLGLHNQLRPDAQAEAEDKFKRAS